MKQLIAVVVSLSAAFGLAVLQAQQDNSPAVPAHQAFHDVIMPMWHQAYPAKDYAALRKLAPEVESGVAKIAAAKLPGILHEKEEAWAKGVAELKSAATGYKKAAAGTDDSALMAAAENLHTVYEALGQVIRPAVPEMNEFHKTMYVVQHTYVPEKNWTAVCKSSGELVTKAEAVAKATLSKRVAAKEELYRAAAKGLVSDAKALAAACQGNKAPEIEKATETMHARYEGLGKIFE